MQNAQTMHQPVTFGRFVAGSVAPFAAVGRFLVRLAESGSRAEQIRRLNALSDEELAARGLTRMGEVHRIFADRFYC